VGDEEGRDEFERFFHCYAHRLVGEAFLLTGDRQDAQDLAQEVLVRVWQHWRSVSCHDHPEAWARHVMRNLAANRWRRKQLEHRHRQLALPEQGQAPDAGHLDIVEGLQQLSKRPRQAMILHAVVGLSVDEIAKELKVPPGTVRSWLHRSRAILAAHLGKPATLAVPGGD
jgi:RNA polymerase sigma-70 factor (sigma-E family)